MAFWFTVFLITVFAFLRFAPMCRHIGFASATAVLILRLVAIAVAILLFNPFFIPSHQTVNQKSRIAVLVDSSISVDAEGRQKAIKALLSALGDGKDLFLAWAFSENLKPLKLEELQSFSLGNQSRLSKAVLEALETLRPDQLLILTDAQDTEPVPDEQVVEGLKKSGTKLSAVILPSNLPPNLSLSVSPTQAFLFSGEEAKFSVQVSGEWVREKSAIQLRVWEGKRLAYKADLSLVKGKGQATVALKPSSSGWNRYRFEVLPVKGEIWVEDNRQEVLIWQAPTKLRVLIVTGQPNFEFKFVKQAIEGEPNFEWVAIASLPNRTRYQQGSPKLMPASLAKLEKFHVAIVMAPTADEFGIEEGRTLWQFVQAGGGLLLTLSEPTIRTNGWRFFVFYPLAFKALNSPSPLRAVNGDTLGEQLPQMPEVDAAWAISSLPSFVQIAVESSGKPVLVWWQEGLGKLAIVAFEGTWRWVMEAALRGEKPETQKKFWRTIVRFLADPTKGEGEKISRMHVNLETPKPPPSELSFQPEPKRVEAWVKATGGQILKPDDLGAWVKNLSQAKTVRIATKQPVSAMPLPYLILLAALTVEWWLIRRSGLT